MKSDPNPGKTTLAQEQASPIKPDSSSEDEYPGDRDDLEYPPDV